MSQLTTFTADEFGKVAVLMGGSSAEREISMISGQAVLNALKKQGINAFAVDVDLNVSEQLLSNQFDRAFNVLHGRGGEDGQIQGVLTSLGIPFTGSGITGAVLSMNKMLSKQVWIQQGLPTAPFVQLSADIDEQALLETIGLPMMVKPVNEGSSIGMTKVNSAEQLTKAIELAKQYDSEVIMEKWIEGEEYTVAILDDEALPVIQLKTPHDFYDFEAKYQANTTEYLCPCGLSQEDELACQGIAIKAFKALRMSGWGRIDFMRDKQGQFYLLEANSVPGMTDHSLVPMAAKAAGIDFEELVTIVLGMTLEVTA
jgi:D-alanine-D-alanine ligase